MRAYGNKRFGALNLFSAWLGMYAYRCWALFGDGGVKVPVGRRKLSIKAETYFWSVEGGTGRPCFTDLDVMSGT